MIIIVIIIFQYIRNLKLLTNGYALSKWSEFIENNTCEKKEH